MTSNARFPAMTALLVLLAAAPPVNGQQQAAPQPVERVTSIGTHSLRARVQGDGPPAVVVDVGIAGRADDWQEIQEALSLEATVVLYDRAGYGESEPGPLPRDSGREADELNALLDSLDVPTPFVLVGHSLGGLNAQVYASQYPEDVAGIVLLDPPPLAWVLGDSYPELREVAERMTVEWQGIADGGATSSDPEDRTRSDFFNAIASEHREMFGRSARMATAIDTFADTPVTVIASGVPNPMFGEVAEEYQAFWVEESRAVASKSSRGELVFVEDSTHMLHTEAADVVLACIRSVILQAGLER